MTEIAEKQVEELKAYTQYLGVTFEDILFDLKRHIYLNQLEVQYSESDVGAGSYDEEVSDEMN